MKELELGDMVEVLFNDWQPRIFIKYGKNDGVICVCFEDEEKFFKEEHFETSFWGKDHWRMPEEKEYVPFTREDVEQLMGRLIKPKNRMERDVFLITEMDEDEVYVSKRYISYETLLHLYEFYDGTPCGKLKKS
jgi:hypothetical protein